MCKPRQSSNYYVHFFDQYLTEQYKKKLLTINDTLLLFWLRRPTGASACIQLNDVLDLAVAPRLPQALVPTLHVDR